MATKKKKAPAEHKIVKRGDGRWAVQLRGGGKFLKGEEKVKVLAAAGLIKLTAKKAEAATEEKA